MTPNLIHFVHTNTQPANICQPLAALLATFAMMEYLLCQGAVLFATSRDQRSVFVDTFQPDISWCSDGELERKDSVLNKNGGALSVCSQLCLMHDETKKIHNIMNMYIYIRVSLGGRGHIALHFDCLHWFVMGFLGQRNEKKSSLHFNPRTLIYKKTLCPRLDPWTKLPSANFSPCFYWQGHHDELPTQPLGHFMVCRSSCNKTLAMERWKGDSEGAKFLPWPTVLMLVGPIQQLLPRLWLPTGPKSFSYKWSERIQKQIMPFLVLARW